MSNLNSELLGVFRSIISMDTLDIFFKNCPTPLLGEYTTNLKVELLEAIIFGEKIVLKKTGRNKGPRNRNKTR